MVISTSIPFKIACCLAILHLKGTLSLAPETGTGENTNTNTRSLSRKWSVSSLSSDKFLNDVDVAGSTSMEMDMQSDMASESEMNESMSMPTSTGLNKNADATANECGGNLTMLKVGEAGMIQSPNYPQLYPHGLNCQWILETDPENQIEMTIFDIRIKSPSFSGEQDNLLVALNKNSEFAQRYSGDLNGVTPFNLLSESNRIILTFHSTLMSTGSNGFKIGYYVDKRGQKPAIIQSIGSTNPAVAGACQASPVDLPRTRKSYNENYVRRRFQAIRRLQRTNPNPHLVALVLDNKHFCSGTLIRDNFVMTSAHCTQNVEEIELIFGTPDITLNDAGVQKRYANVSSVHQHPFFDRTSGSHDISLIQLRKPIMFTKYVKAAKLPQWSNLGIVLSNANFQVSGWGDSKDGSVYAKSRGMELTVLPNAACRSSIHKGLNGLMMCTKGKSNSSSASSSSTCQVDSGSPIIARCGTNGDYKPNPCYTPTTAFRAQLREDRCFLKYYLPQLFAWRSEKEIENLLSDLNEDESEMPMSRLQNSNSTSTDNMNGTSSNPGKPNKGNRPQKPSNQNQQNHRPNRPSQNHRPQKPSNNNRPQKPGQHNNHNNRPQKPSNNRPNKPHNKPNHKPPKPIGNVNGTNGNSTMQNINGTTVSSSNGTAQNPVKPVKPGNNHKPHDSNKPAGGNSTSTAGSGGSNRPQNPSRPKPPGGGRPGGRPHGKPGNGKPGNGKPGNPNGGGCLNPPTNSLRNNCDHFTQSAAVVLGLASFGSCGEGFVFTRITSNLDFIYSTINNF